MGSKKKDLEIIYNLQWKSKSGNGGDKANIIGMYDIPATTLNWEIFKSYLLKNSGTVGDDVKVSYITDSNREFPIESQTDFQIALYAFRRKARMGDIVNLKLDRISDQPSHRNSRHSNDVETQFDTEAASIVSSCCNSESPPEWFIAYMNKFKKNMADEISTAVSGVVANIKPHTVSQPSCYHSRKSKAENSKRRKLPLLIGEAPHQYTKEFFKSLKLESKFDHKLEKLESETKKLKEKKKSLFSKSSDSDVAVGTSSFKRRPSVPCETNDEMFEMDAAPINTQETVPHMLGGEIYLHQWKVINSGKSPWTSETALMFTWGSKALRPLDTIVSVPNLEPGDIGTLSVRLQVPNYPGQYECYFHFNHKGRRFGHWLGCQIIVDPFDLKGNKSVLETSYMAPFEPSPRKVSAAEDVYNIVSPVICYNHWQAAPDSDTYLPRFGNDENHKKAECVVKKSDLLNEQGDGTSIAMDKVVRELSSRIDDIKLQDPTDTNCSSDSDNQSIISLSDSNSSKGIPSEYVVVPIPDCFQLDEAALPKTTEEVNVKVDNVEELSKPSTSTIINKEKSLENFDDNNNEDTEENAEKEKEIYQDALSNSTHKSDIVMVTLPEVNQDSEEYACVIVDGQKVMIPKKMIKSEYLQNYNDNSRKPSLSRNSSPFTEINGEREVKPEIQVNVEKNTESECQEMFEQRPQFEENDFSSHCSAAGSCFSDANAERNSRLFIFPQACPGYEVIQGTDEADVGDNGYTWSKSETNYAFSAEEKETLKPTISHPLMSEPVQVSSNKNPFTSDTITHVPNYQQTPPEERKAPCESEINATFTAQKNIVQTPEEPVRMINSESLTRQEPIPEPSAPSGERHTDGIHTPPPVVNILPESLVNGAVNAVSSVARSVINRIVPQGAPGRWVNGHWVSTNPDSTREANLQALAEMGFWNRDLNATLLARYSDDLSRVVGELVQ